MENMKEAESVNWWNITKNLEKPNNLTESLNQSTSMKWVVTQYPIECVVSGSSSTAELSGRCWAVNPPPRPLFPSLGFLARLLTPSPQSRCTPPHHLYNVICPTAERTHSSGTSLVRSNNEKTIKGKNQLAIRRFEMNDKTHKWLLSSQFD